MKWTPPDLLQPRNGYRYTTDAFVLASFAGDFPARHWCDLGTGSGVIAHALSSRLASSQGVAIERQARSLHYARSNLSGCQVTLVEGDLRNYPWQNDVFDLVVCNPPYYNVGSGHINRDRTIAEARHTFHGRVYDFCSTMRPALKRRGVFCFIYPVVLWERACAEILDSGWYLRRLLWIESFQGREPKLVCAALSKIPLHRVEENRLILYEAHRNHTASFHRYLLGVRDNRDGFDNHRALVEPEQSG